jgi:hypothetical protein
MPCHNTMEDISHLLALVPRWSRLWMESKTNSLLVAKMTGFTGPLEMSHRTGYHQSPLVGPQRRRRQSSSVYVAVALLVFSNLAVTQDCGLGGHRRQAGCGGRDQGPPAFTLVDLLSAAPPPTRGGHDRVPATQHYLCWPHAGCSP